MFSEISQYSQENTCARISFLTKLQASPATFIKMRFSHRCFPVNFVKFLRTPFYKEHLWWLLLKSYNKEPQFGFVEEITLFPLVIIRKLSGEVCFYVKPKSISRFTIKSVAKKQAFYVCFWVNHLCLNVLPF